MRKHLVLLTIGLFLLSLVLTACGANPHKQGSSAAPMLKDINVSLTTEPEIVPTGHFSTYTVQITDKDNQPFDVDKVYLSLSKQQMKQPIEGTMNQKEAGLYQLDLPLAMAGEWKAEITLSIFDQERKYEGFTVQAEGEEQPDLLSGYKADQQQLPVLSAAPKFQLTDNTGEMYDSNSGKIKLLTFIYTNCTTECPMTMAEFAKLQATLKEKNWFGTEVELLSISFDENDTVEDLANYGAAFGQDPTGWKVLLGGTAEEISQLTKDFYYLVEQTDETFFVHSLVMYLLDENNQIRALPKMASPNDSQLNPAQIMQDIEKLIIEKERRNR